MSCWGRNLLNPKWSRDYPVTSPHLKMNEWSLANGSLWNSLTNQSLPHHFTRPRSNSLQRGLQTPTVAFPCCHWPILHSSLIFPDKRVLVPVLQGCHFSVVQNTVGPFLWILLSFSFFFLLFLEFRPSASRFLFAGVWTIPWVVDTLLELHENSPI